ncbi:putative ABC transport system ATP-binding protein/lipoprotein-releasing system ATP-binding protein, partial [Evansella caseinilytica]
MTIIVKQLSKTYDTGTETIRVLNRLDLTMEKGTWATVIGPSGSGKSTLLKCVGGLEKPDTGGEITFDGWHLETAKRDELAAFRREKVGFIFQDYKLFEQFTVLDNVMLPLIPYEQQERLKKKAIAILEMLGLDRRLHHYPAQLSGGEKQRTAIARAMINSPGLLICDEPTGNL